MEIPIIPPDETSSSEYKYLHTMYLRLEKQLEIAKEALELIKSEKMKFTKTTSKDVASYALERMGD